MNTNAVIEKLSRQVGREVSLDLFNDQLEYRRYTGTLIDISPAVIALENDRGEDFIPVNRVSIVGINGLDLTPESERRRVARLTQGLDISEDSD